MTDTKTKTKTEPKAKYPSAVYAAAGVGDFVYEQLRKLQTKAIAFGTEAGAQAPEWKKKVAEFSTKVDADKVRASVVTGTQIAAEKAGHVYDTLVERGEKAFAAQGEASPAAQSQPKAKTTDSAQTAPTAAPAAKKAAPRKKTA